MPKSPTAARLVLCLGLAAILGAADDPIQILTAQRDALRQALTGRFAADEQASPGIDLGLKLDRGIGRRGGMTVQLHQIGGAWSVSDVEGLDDRTTLQGIDLAGLKRINDTVTGDLVFTWVPTGAEDDPAPQSQTYGLDLTITPVEERLVLTCRNMIGGDLTLRFRREGAKWVEEHAPQKPVLVHEWGDFEMAVDDLAPDAEGRFHGRVEFACRSSSKPESIAMYNTQKPVIAWAGQLVGGRVSASYQLTAPGGKHLFGSRTEALTGAIQTQTVAGAYHTKGAKGEFIGRVTGTILPASLGIGALDVIAPPADGEPTRRAAALYRQILVLGYARDRYPAPIPAIMNRTPVPPPTWTDGATGQEAYLAELVRQATAVAAGAPPVVASGNAVDDERFGPYYGEGALESHDGVNLLPAVATGPQRWRHLTGWSFCGPFPVYDQNAPVLHPEVLPAAGVAYERERVVVTDPKTGDNERVADVVGWIPAGQEGALVFPPAVPSAASASHFYFCWYATTELESAVAQKVWLALGIEGRVRLWLDGVPVWQAGRHDEGVTPNRFCLSVPEGRHRLLVRVGSSLTSNQRFDRVDWFEGYGEQPQGRVTFSGFGLSACIQGAPDGDTTVATAVPRAADAPVGYRVDGNGGQPGADPPLAWDLAKRINVSWRHELTRGTADPVPRDGKIFVTAEPHLLHCFDGVTGDERWRVSVNVLPLVAPEFKDGDPLLDYGAAQMVGDQRTAAARGDPAKEAAAKAANQADLAKFKPLIDALKKIGIDGRSGWAAATPVVTADRVYVHFGTGVAACYDHAGQQQWRVATGHPWSEPNMGSPVLAGDLLIVQAHLAGHAPAAERGRPRGEGAGAFGLLALDAATGETRWTCVGPPRRTRNQYARAQGLGNGVALMESANGTHRRRFLITGDGAVVDAQDGTLLRRAIFGFAHNRTPPVVYGDTVYITPVGGIEAVTLWLDAEGRLGTRTRYAFDCGWGRGQAKTMTAWGPDHWMKGPVVTERLICAVKVDSAHVPQHYPLPWTEIDTWDRATGAFLGRERAVIRDATDPTVPPALAGDWLLVGDGGAGVAGFDGIVGYGRLALLKVDQGRPYLVSRSDTGMMRASPVVVGDRLYLRSFDALTCLRTSDDEGRRFAIEVAARTLIDEFPEKPEPQPVRNLDPLADLPVPDGMPVAQLQSRRLPDAWLAAGPFPKGDGDPLQDLGGEAAARPVPGSTATFGGSTGTFAVVRKEALAVDKWGVPTKLDIFLATQRAGNSYHYAYSMLECPQVGIFRFSNPGTGFSAWLAGQPLADNDVVRLGIGHYPLLIKIQLGAVPPFIKEMPLVCSFTAIADPVTEYAAWIAGIKRHTARFQQIIEALPGSQYAGKAVLMLKRVEEWEGRGLK
jgi:outer membrane protein assembly factor BamB